MASRSLNDCDQRLRRAWEAVIDEYVRTFPDHTLIVTCTYRSPEEQFRLYQQGRRLVNGQWMIDADPKTSIVTQVDGQSRLSQHNYHPSRALDFAVLVGNKITWNEREYIAVGKIALSHGLRWGGDWDGNPVTKHTFYDYPHVELHDMG